jgi:hypothetical protein
MVLGLTLIAALSFMMTMYVINSYVGKMSARTCEEVEKETEMIYVTHRDKLQVTAGAHSAMFLEYVDIHDNEYPRSTTPVQLDKEVEEEVVIDPWADLADTYECINTGYITANKLNVRKHPSTDEEVLTELLYMNEVNYAVSEIDGWYVIQLPDGTYGYISSQYVSNEKIEGIWFDVSGDDYTRKSYMDWEKITNHRSRQWRLQLMAYTNEHGIRMINDRYLIAFGQHYTNKIGTYVDVYLNNGEVLKCILGDSKQWRHTQGSNGLVGSDGGAVEFIVNTSSLSSEVRKYGSISYADERFLSRVIGIKVYDKNILD